MKLPRKGKPLRLFGHTLPHKQLLAGKKKKRGLESVPLSQIFSGFLGASANIHNSEASKFLGQVEKSVMLSENTWPQPPSWLTSLGKNGFREGESQDSFVSSIKFPPTTTTTTTQSANSPQQPYLQLGSSAAISTFQRKERIVFKKNTALKHYSRYFNL